MDAGLWGIAPGGDHGPGARAQDERAAVEARAEETTGGQQRAGQRPCRQAFQVERRHGNLVHIDLSLFLPLALFLSFNEPLTKRGLFNFEYFLYFLLVWSESYYI